MHPWLKVEYLAPKWAREKYSIYTLKEKDMQEKTNLIVGPLLDGN